MFDRMKTGVKAGVVAALLSTSFVALPVLSNVAQADSWHHGGNDWRWKRHGWNNGNHWQGNRWHGGYGYYHHDNNWGGAAAAGVIGLAAGAIIANQVSRPYYGGGGSHSQACAAKYRSYNWNTGTYTGYDGLQHRCVLP